ncbi:SAMHD1 [Bugula neritina]|uniref:SAMHD1 n=1 Tax=Bugula neritina TaxID=10212 RepID=A0A7J7K709_BUGNE|nr:SAMHD1 [Bugula neritina]
MDVDKWDYLLRDAHYLGMKQNVEYERFMHSMKVISVNGEMHIGIRDKMFDSVFNMYLSRYRQHKHAYQHPVGVAVDLMVLDAFVKAQDFLKVNGKTLIESLEDAEAFCQLDDSAYYKILHSNPNESSDHGNDLLEAKKIIKRIESRRLYKCIAQHTQKGSALLLTGLEDLLRGVSPIGSFKLHQGARDLGLNTDNPLKHMTVVLMGT